MTDASRALSTQEPLRDTARDTPSVRRDPEKNMSTDPEVFQPFFGELGTPPDGFVPHDGEVGGGSVVLRDGDGVVQVEDDVPPAAGYEHGLARALQHLDLQDSRTM